MIKLLFNHKSPSHIIFILNQSVSCRCGPSYADASTFQFNNMVDLLAKESIINGNLTKNKHVTCALPASLAKQNLPNQMVKIMIILWLTKGYISCFYKNSDLVVSSPPIQHFSLDWYKIQTFLFL